VARGVAEEATWTDLRVAGVCVCLCVCAVSNCIQIQPVPDI